jgi:6-phosphogluconolactonase (cycloisomerase 2 family)
MKNSYLIFFIFFLISGCKNEVKKVVRKIEPVTKFPIITNAKNIKYESFFDEENPTWISTANYSFNYIGKLKDTISLGIESFSIAEFPKNRMKVSKIEKLKRPNAEYYIEWDKKNRYTFMQEQKVEIQISSKQINNFHTALLRNRAKDTIPIGYGNIIPLILEAKNKLGKWKPIQERFVYMCGNGVGTIILPPKELVITLVPIFKGNYKTQLRLSMGNNKSNVILGNINYRQFENKFDENGNYKEEFKKENPENNDR